MSQENSIDAELSAQDNTTDATAQLPATIPSSRAESGIIISVDQVQSIDISDQFTRKKTPDGWYVTLHRPCKVVINLTTSMRKIELHLIEGDVIEKDGADLIVLRKHPLETYKSQKSASPLARNRENLLQNEIIAGQR